MSSIWHLDLDEDIKQKQDVQGSGSSTSTRGLFNEQTQKRKQFVSLLLGDKVTGAINTKQKCPSCNGNFSELDNSGLYCPKCKTRPTRYYITAKKIGIPFLYSAPVTKEPFETYSQALKTLMAINHSFEEALSQGKKFDTSKWLPSEYAEKLLENLCKRWLKNYEPEVAKGVKSKDYVDSLNTICNSFIIPFFKGKHVDNIDDDIEKFYHWLLDKNYSSDYIDTILKTLKTITRKYRPNNIPIFPTFTVIPVKEKQRLGLARELAILEHVPDRNGYRLAILILLRTGMRLNEVVAVKKKDFIDGIIHVEKVISDKRLKLRRKNGGHVPYRLTDHLWQLALAHINTINDEDFVFTVGGKNLTTGRLYKVWTKACKKAGQRHIALRNASRTTKASDIWEKHQNRAKEEIAETLGDLPETGLKHYVIK
ncbi:MAG: tyrosine-type recombinase/integrase [Nitrospirae bacterium]|nr:tyrosine-type recombinase/integrase [Nitrospirota bacterium]